MSPINDGGRAFPGGVNQVHVDRDLGEPTEYGMSLRDWFAGQALSGLIAQSMGHVFSVPPATWAASAYQYADAMLKAREAGR